MEPFTIALFGLGTSLGLLLLLRLGQRFGAAPHTSDPSDGNAALRLLQVGQVLGVLLVAAFVVKGSVGGANLGRDALRVAAFASVGLLLVLLTGNLGLRLLLRSRLPAEIARGNVAAGLAGGA